MWTRRADALSVGQQQRVAAARALMGQPELILADEPTSALDAALRQDFMDLLLQAARDAGSTLVCVSHDEQQAVRFDVQWSLPAFAASGGEAHEQPVEHGPQQRLEPAQHLGVGWWSRWRWPPLCCGRLERLRLRHPPQFFAVGQRGRFDCGLPAAARCS